MNCPGRLLAVAGAGLINLASALAQPASAPLVLINGVVVTGAITSITESGVEISTDGKARTYPFTLLSPGTRHRLDQSYRMNLDAFLSGAPSTAITNPPDLLYNPRQPDEIVDVPTAVSDVPVMVDGRLSAGALALPQPVSRGRFTAWDGIVGTDTPVWAFQYGPGADDVGGFAFPPHDPGQLFTAMLTGSAPRTVTSSMVDKHRSFVVPAFETHFGDMALTTDVSWLIADGSTSLQARIECSINSVRHRFIVRGPVPRMITGDKAMLPRTLFATPALEFRVRIENETPYLYGRIRARQFTLVPGEGLPGVVNVMIKQQDGSNLLIENLQHEQDGTYPLRLNISGLEKGKAYRLEASVDLQPLFGRLAYSELVTLL